MTAQIAVSKQKRDNMDVVIEYTKEDLFAKVKFIYDPKVDLAVGGKIYSDYKRKCKDQLGGQGLATVSCNPYVEAVWNDAITKHIQKNALAQKRSAVYTMMQNKCSGKLVQSFFIGTIIIPVHYNIPENQICVTSVLTRNVLCCPKA